MAPVDRAVISVPAYFNELQRRATREAGQLAGFWLLRDDFEQSLGLPSGEFEIGIAMQDRSFNPDGSFYYPSVLQETFFGDHVLVNGKVWPYLDVDQGKYRFRILNGSQSREYIYRLENITDPGNDLSFTLVGTDLGLISAPIDLGSSTGGVVGPAERMDVVIDFAGYDWEGDEPIRRPFTHVPFVEPRSFT